MAQDILPSENDLVRECATFRVRKAPPPSGSIDATPTPSREVLEATAAIFPRPRPPEAARQDPMPNPTAVPVQEAPAQLFRNLRDHDPQAAQRLEQAVLSMPVVGSDIVGFRLLAELGRGGFARVFLARQGHLANRHVVVKVAADLWGEAYTLAQLQHPNIVPVYSVHRDEPFQVVCMPYLGWTTFQDVLNHVQGSLTLPTTAKQLLGWIKNAPPGFSSDIGTGSLGVSPSPTAALASSALAKRLAGLTYVEAVVWLGAQLAAGLVHAHERGIVHHDLKPANILLTDKVEPMLLDFNAAEDTKRQSGAMIAWVAGTLPYMAPEQLAAIHGEPATVDARCDLYAFGVILFELLTGRYPFKERQGPMGAITDSLLEERRGVPPSLRQYNPAVSPALEAIVLRCLEPDPSRRYSSARELQEDLYRQHTHQPLAHLSEPSRQERMHKWMRRHPRFLTAGLVALCAAVLLSFLGAYSIVREQKLGAWQKQEEERIQREEEHTQAVARRQQFLEDLKTALFLLYTRTNEPDQRSQGLNLGLRLAERYQVIENPSWQESISVKALSKTDQEQLGDAMGELLLLTARALLLQQSEDSDAARRQEVLGRALVLSDRAAACSALAAVSPAWWRQRAALLEALGQSADARTCRAKAEALPLRTAADHYWLASDQISAGHLREALPLLQKAARLEPQNFWAWFVLANCHDRLGVDARAEACYGVCIALRPSFPWSHFNRGLAFLRQQEFSAACDDFDATILLRPDLAEAYLNRALARQGLKQYADAEQDLTEALERGGATRLYFLRARVREKRGDAEGAHCDIQAGLRRPPTDEKSWVTRGYYQIAHDPHAALADFEQALRINPRSADALQNKAHVLAEKLGRNKEALDVLNQSLNLYPDSVKARGGRGVLYARLGQREFALRDAEESLLRDTSPLRLYQVACIYALTSREHPEDRLQAFQLLSSALRKGYGFNLLETDEDLNPLRAYPEFRRLIDAARALRPTAPRPKVG